LSGTKVRKLCAWTCSGCLKLEKVSLPPTLERIVDGCFVDSALEHLDLSRTKLRELGQWTYYGCRKLRKVLLPPTLEEVGPDCFN
jgi:hypothetical protein